MVVVRIILTAVAGVALQSSLPLAGPDFSDWSEPINLTGLNSTAMDQAPAVSKDGLSLYFHSNRLGGQGGNDIYVSQRASDDDAWGPPANLGSTVNSVDLESRPTLSRDGHWLFFSSNRPGGFTPGLDLWASYRQHVHDDFGWEPPVHLGAGVNAGSSSEIEASYVENDEGGAPLLYFVSERPGGLGGFDIYVSELLADGTWGAAAHVPALSSTAPDQSVSVRFDGLEAFIVKGIAPLPAGFDVWVSTRASTFDEWSEPVKLPAPVNSTSLDTSAEISADRLTLYFESSRPGGRGAADLWMTTRTRKHGK